MDTSRDGKTSTGESAHDYDWEAVSAAFNHIYELPEGEQARAVEKLAAGPVRDGVRALRAASQSSARTSRLGGHATAYQDESDLAAFVVRARSGGGETPSLETLAPQMPTTAGPFALLEKVGRGGMGMVFRAEDRSNGQRAAVKVLTADSEDAAARFALEARQLATLDHASIPKLLRQGETDAGQPFIAMEYVEGAPVTEFAAARSLDTTARLALFALVCDAVRHAHLKLVAHLDVKPSNVLGHEGPEGEHRISLIDFGASKSMSGFGDGSGWDAEKVTAANLRPGTPAYAAPEQADGDARAQTMAADVFSLGVLLYELLTSMRPAEGGAPPSRVAPLGVSRQQSWAIDALVERAVDPDLTRRHASADALLTDVKRVQQGRGPAGARAPWTSRALWFAARNRLWIAGTAICVLGTVAGLTLLHDRWSASRREAESDLAVLVSEFLRSTPSRQSEGLLVPAAETIQHGLERQPDLEADLSLAVADVLAARGQCAEAVPVYGRVTLLRTRTAADHPVVVAGLRGQARCAAGRFGASTEDGARRATEAAQEALFAARSRYGERSVVVAAIETDLALYHAALGEFGVAGDLLGSAEAVLGGLDGPTESRRVQAVNEEAGTRIVVFPEFGGPDGVLLARSRANTVFARLLEAQGDYAGAVERARRAVRQTARPSSARSAAWAEAVAHGYTAESSALVRLGRLGEARTRAGEAAAVLQAQFRPDDPRVVRAQTASAALAGTPRRAAALLRGIVQSAEGVGESATLAAALQSYGRALYEAGDAAAAADALERVVSMGPGGSEPRVLALACTDLSRIALESGDETRALERAEDALNLSAALAPAPGIRLDVLLGAATARAEALASAGRADEAVGVLDPVIVSVRAAPAGVVQPDARARAERLLRTAEARM